MSASKNELPVNGRAFQFQFDLEIVKIRLLKAIEIPQPAYMEVVWRRGQNNITTKIKPEVRGTEEEILFNEKVSMISTCILNTETRQFSIKESIVTVVINLAGSPKTFGSLSLNLSTALNPLSQREPLTCYIDEELTGRTKSKIVLKLSSIYLKEMIKGDQQSVGSGVASTKFNPNNTSAYSIAYDAKKYEIPSKDTYSVVSYGNSVRFSGRKDDTTSVRREDAGRNEEKSQNEYSYGYYNSTSTGTGFYNRAAHEYNLPRGTSNSHARPARNSESEASKSNAGEQNSRMLLEEQTKRSKLEAENTKSKVENAELKNRLTEYVRENMKLKEELKKFGENSDSRVAQLAKENEELLTRNCSLSQEIRELKGRFDKVHLLEKESQGAREENTLLLKELKNYEEALRRAKQDEEVLKRQLLQLRDSENYLRGQLRDAQDTRKDADEAKKREHEATLRDLQRELDYTRNSLNSAVKDLQSNQRAHEKELQCLRDEHQGQMRGLAEARDRAMKEQGERLEQANKMSSQYCAQVQELQGEVQRVQAERGSQWKEKEEKLIQDVQRMNAALRDSNSRNEKLIRDKASLEALLKNAEYALSKEAERSRLLEGKAQHHLDCAAKEKQQLRVAIEELEEKNRQLQEITRDQEHRLSEANDSKAELEGLMKLNLQHELELKYKNEELGRLRGVEEEHENLRCRADIQERNYREVEEALEKAQRELKDKNRAHILEAERAKMLAEERNAAAKALADARDELDKARAVIFNGDRQVKEMDQYIFECERRNNELELELRAATERASQVDVQKYEKEISALEARVKELEKRNNEKLLTLESLNKNLSAAGQEIRHLQTLSQDRQRDVAQRDDVIAQLDEKLRECEKERTRLGQELQGAAQERKSNAKKNEMLMEELYVYKKKLEEEKGKASSVQGRNSEDYTKIRGLENELQRKQDKISKLEKELINLENENVKLNIEIMKKLDDFTPQ